MERKYHMSHNLLGSMSRLKIVHGVIYHTYFQQPLKMNHDELISSQ